MEQQVHWRLGASEKHVFGRVSAPDDDPIFKSLAYLIHERLAKWPEALQSPRVCARADYRGTVSDLDGVFSAEDILYLFYEDLFAGESLYRLCRFADVGYRPGDTGDAKNQAEVKIDLPDDALDAFGTVLAPQYEFCRQRFGDAIPATWQF